MGDNFKGRHVIIVDDIFDTGHTLAAVIERLKELGAADVKVCVLLQKKKGQIPDQGRLGRLQDPERIRRRLRPRLQRPLPRPEANPRAGNTGGDVIDTHIGFNISVRRVKKIENF